MSQRARVARSRALRVWAPLVRLVLAFAPALEAPGMGAFEHSGVASK
ncbi:MAG: hypothetical protein ABI950_13700 [Solirubrobacteraceae bacterium]